MSLRLPTLLIASLAWGDELATRVAAILEQPEGVARTHWGVYAVELKTGRVLLDRNSQRLFTPASNTKLYSTALALLKLGPDFRFRTTVVADGPMEQGRVAGDLRIVGGGDPSLSWRVYPYEKGPDRGDPLAAIASFADRIVAQGVKRIDGNIVGDDTRWPWVPYPDGWAIDDAVSDYGAPVSALTINDNSIQITLKPGEAGGLALLGLNPALEYYWLDNRVRTEAGERRLDVFRGAGQAEIRLIGRISPKSAGRSVTIAIDDPALYTAHALYEALSRRGVAIGGRPVARHRNEDEPFRENPGVVELARRESPPLAQIVQVVNKVSQNLHAEIVLREAGFAANRDGSAESGLKELKVLLKSIGGTKGDYDIRDGSGLSRLNLIAPALTVKLLTHMVGTPLRDVWIASLPVGGVDGTLENRFAKIPEGARVQAKTGTISHVNSLSGYIDSQTYGTVVFSIMSNGANVPAAEIRGAVDKICAEIAR